MLNTNIIIRKSKRALKLIKIDKETIKYPAVFAGALVVLSIAEAAIGSKVAALIILAALPAFAYLAATSAAHSRYFKLKEARFARRLKKLTIQ